MVFLLIFLINLLFAMFWLPVQNIFYKFKPEIPGYTHIFLLFAIITVSNLKYLIYNLLACAFLFLY